MTAIHDFDATRLDRTVVERRPYLQLGRAIETPESAPVLMPGQRRAAGRALGEEHGAIERNRSRDEAARNALEERVGHPGAKQGIELELLDLAIVRRRALPPFGELEILVASGAPSPAGRTGPRAGRARASGRPPDRPAVIPPFIRQHPTEPSPPVRREVETLSRSRWSGSAASTAAGRYRQSDGHATDGRCRRTRRPSWARHYI